MAYKYIDVIASENGEDVSLMNKALELIKYNDAHLMLARIDDGLSELYPDIYFPTTEGIL